jgi:hypothetical protein
MAEILKFTGITFLDVPTDVILESAIGKLKSVIVLGYTNDGEEYFAASMADGADALWHLQRAAHKLLSMPETHEP